MTKFPFQLLIKRASSEKQTESLTCTALLRAIPGRRQVYDGLWNGRGVIAKVFSHKISAKRHLKREWRGLTLLQERGLSAPEPVFWGQTEDGRWVAVIEKIADASTLLEVWNSTTESAKELELLLQAGRELAKQHTKGILQKDLHLGNLLLGGDRVFALDPGQMRFFSHEVARKTSISQLALLACCLPDSNTEFTARLCEEYFRGRGWRLTKSDEVLFQKQLNVHRKRAVRNVLKKCLRTSKRYVRIKTGKYVAVFDRSFCQGAEPLDLIEQIDTLMDEGQILKKGNTCYVSRIMWNGTDVAVKRYNHKGFIHSVRHTIKRSRGRHCWLHAHRLSIINIPSAKPLAYIEKFMGPLIEKSYLVSEYVPGENFSDFLRNNTLGEKRRLAGINCVHDLLAQMEKHKISHGDLKRRNILITDNKAILVDLDGMKVHRWKWMYKLRLAKDIERLTSKGYGGYVRL